MSSSDSRRRLALRSAVIATIREWLRAREFVELETPILQLLAGGALARPFSTHHNALGREVTLRMSAQLYLRRCSVGDLERLYELGRCFRNEGISPRHRPEFTLLELTMSYSDYRGSAGIVEALVGEVAEQVLGSSTALLGERTVDLRRQWRRLTLREAIEERTGLDIFDTPARKLCEALPVEARTGGRLDAEADPSWAVVVDALYSRCVAPHLIDPTIVFELPIEEHPCVRRHPLHGELVGESFDVVIGGMEIASGGTEINDPQEQWRRFVSHNGESEERAPHPNDRDYIEALRYGAPPSGGAGIGIDRLLMILLGAASIDEVMLFPSG